LSLRKRIEKSPAFSGFFGGIIAGYLALCDRRIDWQVEGREALIAALADGPVLILMWHSRMAMGARHWPDSHAPGTSLHHRSPLGRISGVMQRREGLVPVEMSVTRSNQAASRVAMTRFRDGASILMTGDGPVGPARELQRAPVEWAARMGVPVFAYAFSVTRGHRFDSWDRLLLPYPAGRGAIVFARYPAPVPHRPNAESRAALQGALETFLNDTTARADALLGLPPGP
jgi:lysophospholipid acyltransferase (LPLAT)-like uncharacterized protein